LIGASLAVAVPASARADVITDWDQKAIEIVAPHMRPLCLSQINSGHICGAVRRGLGGKEYALPS
jgi:hypothetical protein